MKVNYFYGEGIEFTSAELGYDADLDWKEGDTIEVASSNEEGGDCYESYCISRIEDGVAIVRLTNI